MFAESGKFGKLFGEKGFKEVAHFFDEKTCKIREEFVAVLNVCAEEFAYFGFLVEV